MKGIVTQVIEASALLKQPALKHSFTSNILERVLKFVHLHFIHIYCIDPRLFCYSPPPWPTHDINSLLGDNSCCRSWHHHELYASPHLVHGRSSKAQVYELCTRACVLKRCVLSFSILSHSLCWLSNQSLESIFYPVNCLAKKKAPQGSMQKCKGLLSIEQMCIQNLDMKRKL